MASFKPQRLIKIGGHESDNEEFLVRLAKTIAELGLGTVVVHGGGASISELERTIFGREPLFVDGRRSTDSKTLQLAEMVLCGAVNKKIVRAISEHSQLNPIGISGEDARILRAERNEALGFVASEIVANPKPIFDLCFLGYTPVLSPLALDSSGHPLNANADDVACALACALEVEELILLTNVPGVLVNGQIRATLNAIDAEHLIAEGSISGGMIVKVLSAVDAAKRSGARVRICNLETLSSTGGTLIGDHLSQEFSEKVSQKPAISRRQPDCLAPLFTKIDVRFKDGKGLWLRDEFGVSYLDFGSGIAVNALGHQHPRIVQTLMRKATSPLHVSNLFPIEEQEDLARRLSDSCFAERVFFSNSGTEANEAALKFALKYHHFRGDHKRKRIIAFTGGFHGRTLGSLAVTEKQSYRLAFSSHLFEVEFCEFNSLTQINKTLAPDVAVVIVEPIQGEAGVIPATPQFMEELRQLCTRHGIVLVFDEVQCGLMRTGVLWAHQLYNIEPDIMTTAKPLGGGLPLGATLISSKISDGLAPGDHGSTFGGNPLACALALEVFDEVQNLRSSLLQSEARILDAIKELAEQFPQWISDYRGRGLMWGIDVRCPSAEFIDRARTHGLLLLTAGSSTVRILPPLICGSAEIEHFKSKMQAVLRELNCCHVKTIEICAARPSEAVDIFDLLSGWSEEKIILPRTMESIHQEMSRFLVARWNGVVVGCTAWREWSPFHWEIRSLVVARGAQKIGIGQKLTQTVIAKAREKNITEIFALSACPEFFVGLGFTVQERSRYPFKEAQDCRGCSWLNDCRETAVGLYLAPSAKPTLEKLTRPVVPEVIIHESNRE